MVVLVLFGLIKGHNVTLVEWRIAEQIFSNLDGVINFKM
jgi:hypothetical protein